MLLMITKFTCSPPITFASSTHTVSFCGNHLDTIPSPSFRSASCTSSLVMTPVLQAVTTPAHTEPHIVTRPSQYPSTLSEDVEGEARYPIVEAAYCPMMLPFRFRGVCPIPTHFQPLEDKSEVVTHITTQSMRLTLPRTASRISLAKALIARRVLLFTSSSSECGRPHGAVVLSVKIRRVMICWICGSR